MICRTRALLLVAVLLWQSMSMLGSWSAAQRVGQLEHLIVHSQDENHHHHADKALLMDEHDGPVQHLHADSSASTAGLLTSLQPTLSNVRSMSPPELSLALWLSPTLEGPLRPPMQRT